MKLKILLADDVEELAEAVGEMLEYNDYEVDIVYNGKDAFDKAKEEIYTADKKLTSNYAQKLCALLTERIEFEKEKNEGKVKSKKKV